MFLVNWDFQRFFSIHSYVKLWSFHCGPNLSPGSWFEQTRISLPLNASVYPSVKILPPSLLPPPTVAPSPVDHDLIQLISTLHKDVSTEVGIRFWRKRFLKDNKFLITLNIFFWKRARHFVLKIELNSLNPRLLCASFGWNYPCGSGEKLNIDRQADAGQKWSEQLT